MNIDVVRCVVTGHNNGPACPLCSVAMDTAKVVDTPSETEEVVLSYCFKCLTDKPQESVICLLKKS